MASSPIDPRCFQGSNRGEVNNLGLTHAFTIGSSLGVVGSILMLLTIHYGKLRDSPYVYLTCIAAANLIYMVFGLSLLVTGCETCGFSLETVFYFINYFRYCYALIVPHMNSWLALLTLSMTVERFIYVRWPLKTRSLCTRERARKICFAAFLLSGMVAVFQPFRYEIAIVDRRFVKSGTLLETHSFRCAWNADETNPRNRYTCRSRAYPLDHQSNVSDLSCSNSSSLPGFGLQEVPRTNQSSYSLDCLHRYCKLPIVPVDLGFKSKPSVSERAPDSRILESMHGNVGIVVLINGTSEENPQLPRGDLIGSAIRLNDSCVFIIGMLELSPVREEIVRRLVDYHKDTVRCVQTSFPLRSDWKDSFFTYYLRFWHIIQVLTTCILTIFNILIGVEVRRANRDAQNKGLSKTENDVKSQRRIDENRLTMSLLALSSLKIVADVLFITTWPQVARMFYEDASPQGRPMRVHGIISNFFHMIEKSSYFYLLAFINRKFKRVFVQKVLHDKLRIRKLCELVRSMSPNSRKTPANACQETLNQTDGPEANACV